MQHQSPFTSLLFTKEKTIKKLKTTEQNNTCQSNVICEIKSEVTWLGFIFDCRLTMTSQIWPLSFVREPFLLTKVSYASSYFMDLKLFILSWWRHCLPERKRAVCIWKTSLLNRVKTYRPMAAFLSDSSVTNTCGRESGDEIYELALMLQMRYNETQSQ